MMKKQSVPHHKADTAELSGGDGDADLTILREALREAGAIAMNIANRPFEQWEKKDKSPVSEADFAVNAYLRKQLGHHRPGYKWVSEEDEDSHISAQHLIAGPYSPPIRTWCVDPIDGTRGFLEGNDHWVISVALLENMVPVMGAIYNPKQNVLYFANKGHGAWRDAQRLNLRGSRPGTNRIYARKKMQSDPLYAALLENKNLGYLSSLAFRICKVAAGEALGCMITTPCSLWDIAAAQIILEEAGGVALHLDGTPLQADPETYKVNDMVMASPTFRDEFCRKHLKT